MRRQLAALLLACPLLAIAQVYRCEAGGTVSYSDRPCASGARQTQRNDVAAAASGSLDMNISVEQYPVYGRDQFSLDRSLRANGPRGYHGLATWKVNLAFSTRRERELCRIDSVKVTISGGILMPKWIDEAEAPLELQRQWHDSYAALKRHEDGHIQHGRELGLLVRERLMGLGAMACDQVHGAAQREYQRLHENLKERDRQYDLRTRHGTF